MNKSGQAIRVGSISVEAVPPVGVELVAIVAPDGRVVVDNRGIDDQRGALRNLDALNDDVFSCLTRRMDCFKAAFTGELALVSLSARRLDEPPLLLRLHTWASPTQDFPYKVIQIVELLHAAIVRARVIAEQARDLIS